MSESSREIISVGDLNRAIAASLEDRFDTVWVSGEISNFKAYDSGHWYFSLKDEEGQIRNVAPGVADRRVQRVRDQFVRTTLTWRPTDALDTRFKFSYGDAKGSDQGSSLHVVSVGMVGGLESGGAPLPTAPARPCRDRHWLRARPWRRRSARLRR